MSDFIADTNLGHTTDLNSMKAAKRDLYVVNCLAPVFLLYNSLNQTAVVYSLHAPMKD